MAENFNSVMTSLLKGVESVLSTKTVVGEPINVGDTILVPLVDVSFGVGAGAFCEDKKHNAAGGMGGKIMPSAVLVIQNGNTKLVNIKNQDGVTKILDMVPDFVNRFASKNDHSVTSTASPETVKAATEEMETILENSVNKTEE